MKYITISECPPNTMIWFSWNSDRTRIIARVEPAPAPDGKLYTRVDLMIPIDREWPMMQAALRRAGWRLKRRCGVSFTNWILFELVPVKPKDNARTRGRRAGDALPGGESEMVAR